MRCSYHDALLTDDDIDLLRQPHAWLNDACVSFWIEYCRHEELRARGQDVLILEPALSFVVLHAGPAAAAVLEPLRAAEKELVRAGVVPNLSLPPPTPSSALGHHVCE